MTRHKNTGTAALKRWVRASLASPPLDAIGRRLRGLGTCLTYHRVLPGAVLESQERDGFAPNIELAVSVEEFDRQLALLAREYRPISVPEAVEALARGVLPERSVLITFDDGYRDNLAHALPVLRKHGVPATFYLTTGMIDQAIVPWWYELGTILSAADRIRLNSGKLKIELSLTDTVSRCAAFNRLGVILKREAPDGQKELMELLRAQACRETPGPDCEFLSWAEVHELARDPLVTIGAHTRNHFVLTSLSEPRLREELLESRERLERELGRAVEHLAYPYGAPQDASEREFRVAAQLGFRSAFTTRPGHLHSAHRHRLHSLPRIFVGYYDTIENLQWKLSGFSAGLRQLRGRLGEGGTGWER